MMPHKVEKARKMVIMATMHLWTLFDWKHYIMIEILKVEAIICKIQSVYQSSAGIIVLVFSRSNILIAFLNI